MSFSFMSFIQLLHFGWSILQQTITKHLEKKLNGNYTRMKQNTRLLRLVQAMSRHTCWTHIAFSESKSSRVTWPNIAFSEPSPAGHESWLVTNLPLPKNSHYKKRPCVKSCLVWGCNKYPYTKMLCAVLNKILEAAPDKIVTVWQLTSHFTNYPNWHCWRSKERTHKWHSPMDSYTWIH